MSDIGITEILLAVIAIMLVLAQTIQYLAKRKETANSTNGVIGKTVAIYDHGDREKVNSMHSVITAQGWDHKLNTILDLLRDIKRLEDDNLQVGKDELKALRDHFKDFNCLAVKVDKKQ